MGILWYACTAPLWALPLGSWMLEEPTYSVECSVSEFFPDGGMTPTGSLTIVLEARNQAGMAKGSRLLEGTWNGDPTLSIRIKAVDNGGGKFTLDVMVENNIAVPDRGDGATGRGHGAGSPAEPRDDLVIKLPKADDFGGHYEFAFHRKGGRWYQAFLR